MLKIYVISLKRVVERRENIEKQLEFIKENFNVECEIYEGIDGREIEIKEENKEYKIQWRDYIFNHNPNARKLKLSYGEMGCALSHYFIYKKLLEDNVYDKYLILEDDFVLTDKGKEKLNAYLENISSIKNADLIFLHEPSYSNGILLPFNDLFKKSYTNMYYCNMALGYVIYKQGAEKILQYMDNNIDIPADDIFFKVKKLKLYKSIIPLFVSKGYKSSIWNCKVDNEDYRNVSW